MNNQIFNYQVFVYLLIKYNNQIIDIQLYPGGCKMEPINLIGYQPVIFLIFFIQFGVVKGATRILFLIIKRHLSKKAAK